MNWYLKVVFENYFNFSGRARREEYWMFSLLNFIFSCLIYFISISVGLGVSLGFIYGIFVLIPSLSVWVRRLHDINKSGWNVLLVLIPIIGPIILIVYSVTEGDKTENNYGQNPKNDFINEIEKQSDNSNTDNTFIKEDSEKNHENLNSKTSNPIKKSKVYVYARNKKTNKPARFTKEEWKTTSQLGDASLFEVLYDYNEKDYLSEINEKDQSIKKSKQSLINLKKKGLLNDEEYQQKLNNLNQIEFDVFASINDFISTFEKEINDDLSDLKNLYESKILNSEEYLKKTDELKFKSIKECMQEKGINVQLKDQRINLKSFDNIRIESDDKIITENFIGKLKEPKIIKGESKIGFFISLNILKGKPIIVCFCKGEFVKWDPSKCILNNKPIGLYGMEGGGLHLRK